MKIYKKATQATLHDIVKNPKNLKFIELKEAQIQHSFDDVDLAAISTNLMPDMDMTPSKVALVMKDIDSPYTNTIVAIR
ncbi:MetQ/NlpA family ABC transporter substrate-binding protein [Campylobacter sp. RM15925]|uniref:MetQ/NlpA family ABC transporter substrate-binding protein n=1 Tax=Campylobacter sp. RM15925 TaxID=1705724 RepID=UPI001473AF82|nr:MetQ/NlpA family ABC transporter substrate-binding protein [Campylobacter sp. RM15925]